ncbi:MAG: restriction endonuclease [Brevefilum sp.]
MNHLLFAGLGLVSGGVSLAGLIYKWRKGRIRLADARTLDSLLALSPKDFEQLVAELFEAYGHQAEIAGGTADHGVDVIVRQAQGEKWVVQCKRYAGSVGEPMVRDLLGTLQHEEAQRAYLITTGSFTSRAKAWAEGKPLMLYDGEQLVKLIRRTVNRNLREK